MPTSLTERLTRRPKRTLLATLALVVVAGVVGGPVAGVLDDTGGFAPADAGSVRAACAASLASFKVPVGVVRVDALPRTALGKVQKHLLPAWDGGAGVGEPNG